MKIKIYVLAGEEKEARELCRIVEECSFRADSSKSLAEFKESPIEEKRFIVLLDLDSIGVDGPSLKKLKRDYPSATIMTVSSARLHPHLKEAFETDIYASLAKPVDRDELIFLVESVIKDFGR